jgi:FkbM family methyltransferase
VEHAKNSPNTKMQESPRYSSEISVAMQPSIAPKLHSAAALISCAAGDRALDFNGYAISAFWYSGIQFAFAANDPADLIQEIHMHGSIYEEEELEIIRRSFKPGGVFVDAGSNIGNHAIYVAKAMRPSRIICFEPNPTAYNTLALNCILNRVLGLVDLRHIGYGLSDCDNGKADIVVPEKNMGAARLTQGKGGGGEINLIRGDSALGSSKPSFIKIDVEGMEMKVLDGLSGCIANCRPRIFVEINNSNTHFFQDWVKGNSYKIVESYKRYAANENFLVYPLEDPER